MSSERSFFRRGAILALIAVAVTAACLYGIVWFQDAPLREAERLLASGNASAALRIIEKWEADRGIRGSSHALRARCFVELGRFSEAIAIFEAIGAEQTEEIHAWARAWLHLRQWAHALPLLEEVRRRDRHNPDVLHELASCRAKLGMLNESLDSAREFAKHTEFAHRGWLLIGMLLRDQGSKSQAAEAWSRVETLDPDFDDLQIPAEEFLTQFASLQLELGNPSRAARLLRTALAKRETAEAHFQFGLAEEQLANLTAAEQHWSRALELEPAHLSARESLARLAISSGDGILAEHRLRPALKNAPLRSSTTYLMQRAAYLQGDRAAAEEWRAKTESLRRKENLDSTIVQLLRESPRSYWAQVVRSYQFAERGNWRQAAAVLERLPSSKDDHQFVVKLREAVESRGELPSTELLPIASF